MGCSVLDCDKKVVSKGLCDTHRKRLERNGHLENTRPADWGKREKHPLYGSWVWMKRAKGSTYCEEWHNFWKFVEDVGERPSPKHVMAKLDPAKPYSKDNFYWRESLFEISREQEVRKAKAEWMRNYRQLHPEKFFNYDLKRNFGITYSDYVAMLEKQNYACAICNKVETSQIKGKVLKLAVDHCHQTGKIRGLLCTKCNTAIGSFNDNPELLQSAIQYLLKHKGEN